MADTTFTAPGVGVKQKLKDMGDGTWAEVVYLGGDVGGSTQVNGYGFDVVDAPTVTNGAYSAGDVIGGYRTVTLARENNEPIIITGVQVIFKAAVQPNIRVVMFGATPAALLADNDAYSLSTTDVLAVRRSLSSVVLVALYTNHGTPKSISLTPPPFVMVPITGGKTVGYYLIDDSGVTLASTADVQVRFSGVGA